MTDEEGLNHGRRKAVRNFEPSWFPITMVWASCLFYYMSYLTTGDGSAGLLVITFCLNVFLFLLVSLVLLLRYVVRPEMDIHETFRSIAVPCSSANGEEIA